MTIRNGMSDSRRLQGFDNLRHCRLQAADGEIGTCIDQQAGLFAGSRPPSWAKLTGRRLQLRHGTSTISKRE
jgi:hypothetical protein